MKKTESVKQWVIENKGKSGQVNKFTAEEVSKHFDINIKEATEICEGLVKEGLLTVNYVAKCHVCNTVLKTIRKRQTCFIHSCFNCGEEDVDVPEEDLEEEFIIV